MACKDSIIIWSLSITKLTPAQFKNGIYFFQNFFFPLQDILWAERPWYEDQGQLALLLPPLPLNQDPVPLGQRESGKRYVEKRANISLFNWFWLQFSPCWLYFWRQTLMGWRSPLYGTCPHTGWLWAHVWVLRRPFGNTHCTVPLYLRSSCCRSTSPPFSYQSCHWLSPHRRLWLVSSPSGQSSWPGLQWVGSKKRLRCMMSTQSGYIPTTLLSQMVKSRKLPCHLLCPATHLVMGLMDKPSAWQAGGNVPLMAKNL